MKKVNLLSRDQMKKVIGGLIQLCEGKEDIDLAVCNFNVCMAGWDSGSHDDNSNSNKIDECCRLANYC